MYEAHFGLIAPPFSETTDPAAYLSLPSRDAALLRLRYALERGSGMGLLLGSPGSGKTLLARRLIKDLGWPAIHMAFPVMSPAELVAFLADELAAPPDPAPGTAGSVRRVRAALAANVAKGSPTLLVVDEIHLIDDPQSFEILRLLQNFTSNGRPDLALLFVGNPEGALKMPHALRDRLGAHCVLPPLTLSESSEYLLGRLAAVTTEGTAVAQRIDANELATLHQVAAGIPRRLNRLADLVYLVAYARDLPCPDADAVVAAIHEAASESLAA